MERQVYLGAAKPLARPAVKHLARPAAKPAAGGVAKPVSPISYWRQWENPKKLALAAAREAEKKATRETAPARARGETRGHTAKVKRAFRVFANVLFYAAISLVLLATVLVIVNSRFGGSVLGYTGFTILSGSMESVYPKGALVIVQHIEPSTLNVGDDITYLAGPDITVSHRVVDIVEDYEGSGARGFVTQGVENTQPDAEVVYAANVVGRVVYSIPQLGAVLSYIHDNLWMVAVLWGLLLVFSFAIRVFIGEPKGGTARENRPAGKRVEAKVHQYSTNQRLSVKRGL